MADPFDDLAAEFGGSAGAGDDLDALAAEMGGSAGGPRPGIDYRTSGGGTTNDDLTPAQRAAKLPGQALEVAGGFAGEVLGAIPAMAKLAASPWSRALDSDRPMLERLEAALMPANVIGKEMATGIQQGADEQALKATQAYDEGRTSEMLAHGAATLLPMVGPAAASVGEQAGTGDPAALGRGAALAMMSTARGNAALAEGAGVAARGAQRATNAAGLTYDGWLPRGIMERASGLDDMRARVEQAERMGHDPKRLLLETPQSLSTRAQLETQAAQRLRAGELKGQMIDAAELENVLVDAGVGIDAVDAIIADAQTLNLTRGQVANLERVREIITDTTGHSTQLPVRVADELKQTLQEAARKSGYYDKQAAGRVGMPSYGQAAGESATQLRAGVENAVPPVAEANRVIGDSHLVEEALRRKMQRKERAAGPMEAVWYGSALTSGHPMAIIGAGWAAGRRLVRSPVGRVAARGLYKLGGGADLSLGLPRNMQQALALAEQSAELARVRQSGSLDLDAAGEPLNIAEDAGYAETGLDLETPAQAGDVIPVSDEGGVYLGPTGPAQGGATADVGRVPTTPLDPVYGGAAQPLPEPTIAPTVQSTGQLGIHPQVYRAPRKPRQPKLPGVSEPVLDAAEGMPGTRVARPPKPPREVGGVRVDDVASQFERDPIVVEHAITLADELERMRRGERGGKNLVFEPMESSGRGVAHGYRTPGAAERTGISGIQLQRQVTKKNARTGEETLVWEDIPPGEVTSAVNALRAGRRLTEKQADVVQKLLDAAEDDLLQASDMADEFGSQMAPESFDPEMIEAMTEAERIRELIRGKGR